LGFLAYQVTDSLNDTNLRQSKKLKNGQIKMKTLAIVLFSCVLVACGGGGSSPALSTPDTPADLTVSGTAATGKAIAGTTISAKCQVGTGAATTIADGTYSLVVAGGKFPCLLQITDPADGSKLHTVVTGTGSTATANITPLTEMLTARVLGHEPSVFFAAFDASVATVKVTTATVKAAQTDVRTVLTGIVDTNTLSDFISTPLKAATKDNLAGGDAQDKLLDGLRIKINSAQLTQVVAALAGTQNTDDIKQAVANIAVVPPVAKAGVAQSVVAGTVVSLDGSASRADLGRELTFVWTLASKPVGSSATLSSSTTATPSFVADVAGTYVATLIVNDGKFNSSVAPVTITAAVVNALPIANAGVAQYVIAGDVVTLDASASSDANNDRLAYAWTLSAKPAGSSASLSSLTSTKPTFNADVAGLYVATVIVNDGKVNSSAATVSITSTAATTVKGTILSNTTWSSGTYLLDGVVSVPPSVTLRIMPGVTVIGKNSTLIVAGSIVAIGTQNNKIVFTSHPTLATGGALRNYNGIVLSNSSTSNIEHVIIENANTALSLDGNSVIALRNVTFKNNGTAVSDQHGYQMMDIQYCSFVNNDSAFDGIRTSGGIFAWNNFQNNINVFKYGYYFGSVNISNNNFVGNSFVVRAPEAGYGYGSLDMKNNWWGTSDSQSIESLIFDLLDLGTLQKIPYLPILVSPETAGAKM
jgi:hypothetical protein